MNKVYSISIIFGAVSLLLVAFLIYPALSDIQKISDDILRDKNSAALITAEAGDLDNFNKNYPSYEANLKKIDQLFVDSDNPIEFIKFLENTADASGVAADINLSSNAPSRAAIASPTTVFQIRATGEFSKMLKFANRLETRDYLIKIQNISLTRSFVQAVDGKAVAKGVDANFIIEAVAK